jgi:hypothetical protein
MIETKYRNWKDNLQKVRRRMVERAGTWKRAERDI